ncbi:MAG TPA: methyltransferase domain-containing protein [Acidobacteriaceae bacterium]|nr:methyltransferase domain-containing protein [Acidobacteriaceae bacterium]
MLRDFMTSDPYDTLSPLTYARRAEPADLPELMDQPCTYEEFRDCLRDLAEVNRITQAYKPTLAFLSRIAERHEASQPLRILDVGSGGGDGLRAIAHWAHERDVAVELTGIDLNPYSARAAREFGDRKSSDSKNRSAPLAANIKWLTADVFSYAADAQPDVIVSALFTHHLSSPEIVRFLQWSEQTARLGWFINDLHRSRRAAFFFRFLPVIFGWHPFIRHDGPVSLWRAFVPADWQKLLDEANISGASIESHAMNRLCVARIRQVS